MLKATFEASFDMEAAMPQLLEAAIYDCYQKYGWDIDDDTNKYCDNPFKQNGLYFPTLTDLIQSLKTVIGKQGFDKRMENDYIGSLVSRLNSLVIGAKGQMLNCKKSIDFDKLLDRKVIFELEDLKSGSDKALIMGFILSRLGETIKKRHEKDDNFKHLLLIEEAHRLLAKFEPGDSMNKKHGIEVFTDLLAEVRKYGESLIIVDQIPNKLTTEVLKNTNTKIIHKLFAKDDKESVGDTMEMTDEQKSYLSNLKTGEVVVFSEGWNKPVLAKITMMSNTSKNSVKIDKIKEIGKKNISDFIFDFYPELALAGIKNVDPTYKSDKKKFLRAYSDFQDVLKLAWDNKNVKNDKDLFLEEIKESKNKLFDIINEMVSKISKEVIIEILKIYYGNVFIEDEERLSKVLNDFISLLLKDESIFKLYSENQSIFNKN